MVANVSKKDGYTLIEVLVALVIFAILLLGLLAGLLTAYDLSTRNLARDEAIKIAQEFSERFRSMDFDSIGNETVNISRQIRNSSINYTITTNVTNYTSNDLFGDSGTDIVMKRALITITWDYKGKTYSYQLETIIRKE